MHRYEINAIPGMLHKYKNRVLMIVKGGCAVNCRYCFRRHFPYQDNQGGKRNWQTALDYIASQPEVNEVILSGGDPLMAKDHELKWLVDGISHPARLLDPYPFRAAAAKGARVWDIDGNELIDFWQGHFANILGHNPPVIRDTLANALAKRAGLQTGLPEETAKRPYSRVASALGTIRYGREYRGFVPAPQHVPPPVSRCLW